MRSMGASAWATPFSRSRDRCPAGRRRTRRSLTGPAGSRSLSAVSRSTWCSRRWHSCRNRALFRRSHAQDRQRCRVRHGRHPPGGWKTRRIQRTAGGADGADRLLAAGPADTFPQRRRGTDHAQGVSPMVLAPGRTRDGRRRLRPLRLPVLAFPTSGGGEWELENMGLIQALASFVDAGRVKFYVVGSNSDASYTTAARTRSTAAGCSACSTSTSAGRSFPSSTTTAGAAADCDDGRITRRLSCREHALQASRRREALLGDVGPNDMRRSWTAWCI